MSELKLKLACAAADKLIEERKREFFRVRRELDNKETLLVEAREAKRHAEEELYEFNRTNIMDTTLNDIRDKQVADYRSRMPESMDKIKDEPKLPYKMMTDLGTIEAWPKSRYSNETDSDLDD